MSGEAQSQFRAAIREDEREITILIGIAKRNSETVAGLEVSVEELGVIVEGLGGLLAEARELEAQRARPMPSLRRIK